MYVYVVCEVLVVVGGVFKGGDGGCYGMVCLSGGVGVFGGGVGLIVVEVVNCCVVLF